MKTVSTTQPQSAGGNQTVCSNWTSVNHLTTEHHDSAKGLFPTAYIRLVSNNGNCIVVKAFFDISAERTFVAEQAAQQHRIKKKRYNIHLTGMGNSFLGS